MDIKNGPAFEYNKSEATIHNVDGNGVRILNELIKTEQIVKEQIASGNVNPRLIAQLGSGYNALNITAPDPKSDDIMATVTGLVLARLFKEAYENSLPKQVS